MGGWSRLKKWTVISTVAVLGVGGVGALTDSQNTSVKLPSPTPPPPQVEGESTPPPAPPPIQLPPPPPPVVTPPPPAPTPPTTQSSSCDPNYTGCVPNVYPSDVDCAGGSGNGPYYTGPVQVIGVDRYDLDRDSDGYACE